MRFEHRAAYVLGVAFPLLETLRRRTDFSTIANYVDDYIMGGLLIAAAISVTRQRPYGRRFLAGAWGIACGAMYYSFFGQLQAATPVDVSGLPHGVVACIKCAVLVLAIAALVQSVRSIEVDPNATRPSRHTSSDSDSSSSSPPDTST